MKRVVMILAALVVLPFMRPAQAAEIRDILSGEMFPLTVSLQDLDSQWRRITVSGAESYASFFTAMVSPAGGAYYTRGETVTLADQVFIVAYEAESAPMNFMELMMEGPTGATTAETLTPESPLSLALLNLRAITAISGIRPFDMEQEIAESERLAASRARFGAEEEGDTASNLRQMALALLMWAQDYDETLPPMQDELAVQEALTPYVKDEVVFFSAGTGEAFKPNSSLSGARIATFANPDQVIALYEATADEEGGRWVAFLDGHVTRVGEEEWQRLARASNIPIPQPGE